MFNSFLKSVVTAHSREIRDLKKEVMDIRHGQIPVFIDHESGAVYAQKFGVAKPCIREQHCGAGGGGGADFGPHAVRIGHSVTVMMAPGRIEVSHERTAPTEKFWFHRDRVPDCDYVKLMLDGSLKFYKKAPVLSDTEVTAKGKVIKAKK